MKGCGEGDKEDINEHKQPDTWVTRDSNDSRKNQGFWTPRNLIEVERGIGIELREMSKDWIRDNNNEEPTISKDNLEGFRCRALLVDHSAMILSLHSKQNRLLKLNGWKDLRRIHTSSVYMKSLEDREALDKSETKILKIKDPRME